MFLTLADILLNPIKFVVIVLMLILIVYFIYAFNTKHWPF